MNADEFYRKILNIHPDAKIEILVAEGHSIVRVRHKNLTHELNCTSISEISVAMQRIYNDISSES